MRAMDLYGDDLAYIHDAGFSGFARAAAPALLEILRRHRIETGLVVDLGCGGGIWLQQLHRAGYTPVGVDVSPSMLALARERVPEARLDLSSLSGARLPNCHAVTSLGECLNYQSRGGRGADLGRVFHKVWRALQPGGLFIFDVAGPGRGATRQSHREGPDWTVLVDVQEDVQNRRLTRRVTSFRLVGELYRKSTEIHRLRLYPPGEVLSELRRQGFRARTLASYGGDPLPCGCTAFLARKPSTGSRPAAAPPLQNAGS